MNGVLLIDKPVGLSSQQVLSKIKRILNVKKIGHAGTLDPLATGVLVVLINDATKLSDYLLENEKAYLSEITIGKTTDTLDSEGEVTEVKKVTQKFDVDSLLQTMLGEHEQIPPMYSALKVNGKKLYELARIGVDIKREARKIAIKEIRRTSDVVYEADCLRFSFYVKASKGTYIRTLCADIGEKIDYPAYMSSLRRVTSGHFSIDNCYTIDDIQNGKFELISMLDAISSIMEKVEVSGETLRRVLNGREIQAKYINSLNKRVALYNCDKLIAIYEKCDKENDSLVYKAIRVWN